MADVVIHTEAQPSPQLVDALRQTGLDLVHARTGAEAAPVHVLDLRLADALKVAARTSGSVVAVVDPADHATALQHLGGAFSDVVVRPSIAGELAARVRVAARSSRDGHARSRALRMVAHDVNNPLTAIRLLAEMLTSEVDGPEAQQDMQDILEASDLAAAYVESLSALARLEAISPTPTPPGPVDAAAVLAGVLRRPCLRAHVSGHPPDGALVVRADRAALQQAILDLLLTARRLAEGHDACRAGAITHQGSAVISVDAVGASMPEELVHHLFEPYGSAALREAKVQVAPAGLAHAHRFAQRSGGALHLSQGPSGIRLSLTLPLVATA